MTVDDCPRMTLSLRGGKLSVHAGVESFSVGGISSLIISRLRKPRSEVLTVLRHGRLMDGSGNRYALRLLLIGKGCFWLSCSCFIYGDVGRFHAVSVVI